MSSRDRSIVVRLRAEVDEFNRRFQQAAQTVDRTAQSVEQAAERMAAAQRRQLDTAGQLRVAEERLSEVRGNSKATSAQVAAAEESVAKAKRDHEAATGQVERAERDLTSAREGHTAATEAAEQANRDLAASQQEAAEASSGLSGFLRTNREDLATVGSALTVYGTAVTGAGAALLTLGINYNQLRQRSVAALTALTGSAEQANAQMDRMDEFASTSPFARDVFIRAQQQMMAFGIAAEDVVPWLDRIQDTVAATGGSNQDIAELANIIARVGSVGKISANDLNELGYRGINAAKLIGDQMGMTEAQIRDSITRGTLDAGDALDALGAGMVETYGGAAALVKETLDGAFDRVKAAVRDLGAWLAEPLVSADGGGLLLDLLNGIADALRWFEGLPDPFRNIVVGLGLLTGPLALAAGGFLLLGPRVLDTYDALRRLNSDLPLTQGRMGSLLGNVGKLAGAMAVLAVAIPVAGAIDDALTYTVDLDRLTAQLINLADATDFADSSIRGMSGNFTDSIFGRSLDTGAEQLDRIASRFESAFGQGTLTRVERTASALGNVMPFIGTAFDGAVDAIESYDQSLSQLANGGNAERAAEMFEVLYEAASRDVPELSIEQMLLTMPEYEKYLIGVANELGVTTNAAVLAALALGDIDGAITASEMSFFAQVVAELAEELGHVAGESERLADALSDSAGGLASGIAEGFSSAADAVVSEADRIVEEGLAKLRQEFGELVVSTAESSAAIMDWSGAVGRSMVGTDNATFSLSKYVAELERMAEAQLNFESNLDRLLVEFGPAFTEHMSQLDPQITAAMVRDLDEGRGDLARAVYDSWESTNPMARQAWASQHEILRSMWLAAAAEMGEDGATKITDGIRTGALDAMDAIREHGLEVELQVLADAGDPAAQHILDLLEEDEFRRITAHLDVDPATFEEKLAYLEQHTHDTVFMPKLSADPASAEEKLAFLLANTDDAVGTVTLDADPTNADYKLSQHLQDADTSTGTATIDADAAPAESERQAWLVDVDGTTGVVTMDGDGSLAFSELSLVNQYVNSSNPTVTIGAVIGQSVWNALGSIRSSFQSVTANLSSRFAGGGAVVGVGTGTSDSIPALLSNGEFVFTDAAVRGAGGFGPMYSMMHSLERGLSPLANLPAYALGGPVQPNYARVSPAPVVVQGGGGESVAALSSRIDRLASVIEADRGRPIQTSVELDGRALAKATHTSVGGRRVEGGAW